MSKVGLVIGIIAIIGFTVWFIPVAQDEIRDDVREAAIERATAACNAHLPGDDWSVANRSVDISRLGDVQSLACARGDLVREINVSIQVEFAS